MELFSVIYADSIDTAGFGGTDQAATIKGFEGLFANTLSVVIELAAVIFFVMLLVGGFKFITSGGNPKMVEAAKGTITYAVLGIVLTLSAYFIIQVVQTFTGANITNFSVTI